MHHDSTDAHLSIEYKEHGKDNDQHHPDLLDKRFQAFVHIACPAGLQLVVEHLHLHVVLFLSFRLFPYEALDHRDRVDDIDQSVIFTLTLSTQLNTPSFQPSRLSLAHIEISRYDDRRQQSYIKICIIHHHKGDNGSGEKR
ncbi:hypothetical protein SDC9_208769 [bioreactor metagenome]|uniref:Uncharacterized protein n=1 Tax=bioreactor metagenome TaxID=1076179 RepID=A0A645JBE7_9ZZZZ